MENLKKILSTYSLLMVLVLLINSCVVDNQEEDENQATTPSDYKTEAIEVYQFDNSQAPTYSPRGVGGGGAMSGI